MISMYLIIKVVVLCVEIGRGSVTAMFDGLLSNMKTWVRGWNIETCQKSIREYKMDEDLAVRRLSSLSSMLFMSSDHV